LYTERMSADSADESKELRYNLCISNNLHVSRRF